MRPATSALQTGVGTSAWLPVDSYDANGTTTVFSKITGAVTYSVEVTPDDVFDPNVAAVAYACDVAALTAASANASGVIGKATKAIRINVTAGTGTVQLVAYVGGMPSSAGGGGGGDATAANQVTGNASLSSIDGKLNSGTTVASNSTTTPLGISGVFLGSAWVDTLNFSQISVSVIASQASATDGLAIQQSTDAVNVGSTDLYTVPAATDKVYNIIPQSRYVRISYTNGGVAQATFRLQLNLRVYVQPGSIQRPQDARTNDNDYPEGIVYPSLFNGTTWDRARGTIANGMAVDVTRIIPGVTATALAKAEDAAAASGDTGVFTLGVQRDTLASQAANGDYHEFAVDTYGSQLTKDYEKHARTYSAAANVAPAATATDVFTITGSATTTVYITKVSISGTQTTGGAADTQLIKRSAANTGGTSGAATAVPHDSADAAATATCLSYTANPTPGAAVGTVRRRYVQIPAVTGTVDPGTVFDFGKEGRPIILRGIAQVLAVNLSGLTLTGGVLDIFVEWFEI